MPAISKHRQKKNGSVERVFAGFALPTSNTTYTPNQYFDVCLPHQSRGVVRLVGYLIRKTLGWCDEHGNPQNETVGFSYRQLEKHAGLGHSMIRLALDDSEKAGFIRCLQAGQPSSKSASGNSFEYELAWDEGHEYVKKPKDFSGFFAGEGNRTYIPNQFFDRLVPNESLAMIQVVGAIIRFSIGFVNKYGHRRQRVALSYLDIQRYTKIASPRILSKTIRDAIEKNYVERVEDGYFDPNGGRMSRSAHYAIKWLQSEHKSPTTPKSEAGKNHSEKVSGSNPKSEAADHSEKVSGIQIKQINKTLKQQYPTGQAIAVTFERLKAAGFDERAAEAIANRYSAERIDRQLRWIDRRKIKSNRLGMIRAAIDQDWSEPGVTASPRREQKFRRLNFAEGPISGIGFTDAVDQTKRRLLDVNKSKLS